MPLVIDAPEASFRLNYLFNRVEISHDFRQTWSIFYEDETHPLGTFRGLTFHRGELFLVTDTGIFSTNLFKSVLNEKAENLLILKALTICFTPARTTQSFRLRPVFAGV